MEAQPPIQPGLVPATNAIAKIEKMIELVNEVPKSRRPPVILLAMILTLLSTIHIVLIFYLVIGWVLGDGYRTNKKMRRVQCAFGGGGKEA